MDYTARELMVVCAARQIHDGENVFVGMRLPLIAFALAKRTHAPNCIGLFETGIVRDMPSPELLYTMGDAPNIYGALWATSTLNVMRPLAAGDVHLGFIGGAEVDRYGNLNTSLIGDWRASQNAPPRQRRWRRYSLFLAAARYHHAARPPSPAREGRLRHQPRLRLSR